MLRRSLITEARVRKIGRLYRRSPRAITSMPLSAPNPCVTRSGTFWPTRELPLRIAPGSARRTSSRWSSRTSPMPRCMLVDFLFGYLVADNKEMKKQQARPAKRDSVLRMNMAVALSPYRFDATFHQSPLKRGRESVEERDLLGPPAPRSVAHRVSVPLRTEPERLRKKRRHPVGQGPARSDRGASNVAGSHARSYFETAPRSRWWPA